MTESQSRNSPECPACGAAASVPARMILYPEAPWTFGAFCFGCFHFYAIPEAWEWIEWAHQWNRTEVEK